MSKKKKKFKQFTTIKFSEKLHNYRLGFGYVRQRFDSDGNVSVDCHINTLLMCVCACACSLLFFQYFNLYHRTLHSDSMSQLDRWLLNVCSSTHNVCVCFYNKMVRLVSQVFFFSSCFLGVDWDFGLSLQQLSQSRNSFRIKWIEEKKSTNDRTENVVKVYRSWRSLFVLFFFCKPILVKRLFSADAAAVVALFPTIIFLFL